VSSRFSFFLPVDSLSSNRAASVAILPSALLCERFSLGASWASSFQQVLLPDNRPCFRLCDGAGSGISRSHLNSAVELGSSHLTLCSVLTTLWLFRSGS
jgi:hypothetical protein